MSDTAGHGLEWREKRVVSVAVGDHLFFSAILLCLKVKVNGLGSREVLQVEGGGVGGAAGKVKGGILEAKWEVLQVAAGGMFARTKHEEEANDEKISNGTSEGKTGLGGAGKVARLKAMDGMGKQLYGDGLDFMGRRICFVIGTVLLVEENMKFAI